MGSDCGRSRTTATLPHDKPLLTPTPTRSLMFKCVFQSMKWKIEESTTEVQSGTSLHPSHYKTLATRSKNTW